MQLWALVSHLKLGIGDACAGQSIASIVADGSFKTLVSEPFATFGLVEPIGSGKCKK